MTLEERKVLALERIALLLEDIAEAANVVNSSQRAEPSRPRIRETGLERARRVEKATR